MQLKLAFIATIVVSAIAAGPASAGGNQIPTQVFVDGSREHYFEPEQATRRAPNGYDLFGHVESNRAPCRKGRKVTVFRAGPGPDEKLGSDVGDSNGGWSLYLPIAVFDAGNAYFAKISKRKLGGSTCKADRSAKFNVEV